MTGFGDNPDKPEPSIFEGVADEELFDRSKEIDNIRAAADRTAHPGVRRWLNEYADLLDRGVGQIRIDDTAEDVIADIEVMIANASSDMVESQAKAALRESHSEQMMVRSGNVHDPRPLVAFLYFLARDGMPVGDVEGILIRLRELERDFGEYGFTNGWLARWAQDAAERLGIRRGSPMDFDAT